jgi:hypothetical protein
MESRLAAAQSGTSVEVRSKCERPAAVPYV